MRMMNIARFIIFGSLSLDETIFTMLNTFENSDRFHARRLERQRHLQYMDDFSIRLGSGDHTAVASMADAYAGDPLAPIVEEAILPKPRIQLRSKLTYSFAIVFVLLVVVSITGLFLGMNFNENSTPATESNPVSWERNVRYEELFSSILGWGLTNRNRLQDSSSPQGRALAWLASDEYETQSSDESRTRFALATLFYGTQNETVGLSWIRKNLWLSNSTVCGWYGVTCVDGNPQVGLVKGLNLSSNGLSNALSDEIGLLGFDIWILDLSNNAIGGLLPENLAKLENLKGLYLGSNLFTSTLPSSISQLYSLTSLYINDCLLTGSIPTELPSLTNLHALSLHDNQLSGSIPYNLFRLTALAVLYLDENLLSGTIPLLPRALIDLRLRKNRLEGPIHDDFGNLQSLQVCYLDSNRLSGKLPEGAIGALRRLQELHLYDNDLTGPIPYTIGKLELLRVLYLDRNNFSNSIPYEVGGMRNLESLYLFENKISGNLPSPLGILSNLKQFVASNNHLQGSIPEQIGSLTNLLDLRLSNNSIAGSIPQSLSGLTSLMRLQLHGNNLTGTAPIGLCLLTTSSYQLRDFTADCSMKNMEVDCACCSRCYHD